MIGDLLLHTPWLVALLWAGVYISDFGLTLFAARMYQGPLKEHIAIQGSYELTPVFQKDINALRIASPAFLVRLALTTLAVFLIGWLSWIVELPQAFMFAAGGMFLLEAAVHLRHSRNIALSYLSHGGQVGLVGRLEHARWLTLRTSAAEMASFAGLYLILGAVIGSWAFAGGAVFCARTALAHWAWARKSMALAQSTGD